MAMAAVNPESVNQSWFKVVTTVNADDLPGISDALSGLRS